MGWLRLPLVGALVVAVLTVAPATTESATVEFWVPAPAGTTWEIIAGYNTATHSEANGGDPYAIDIVRRDGETAGTPVLAPIDGTITFVSSSCVGIRDARENRVLLCHLLAASGLDSGQRVTRGGRIGTVAPAYEAGNNGLPHIHLAVHAGDGRWRMAGTIPMTGPYAPGGVELPASTAFNAHAGTVLVSGNAANRVPSVSAGADLEVAPGSEVVIRADGRDPEGAALTYLWSQSAGPAVTLQASGPVVSFVAPEEDGASVTLRVMAIDSVVQTAMDSVVVRVVSGAGTIAVTPISNTNEGRILSGEVGRDGGFGMFLFGGGSADQLVAATACPVQALRLWVTAGGSFVPYIPAAASFVNERWFALFPDGVPANTILVARCDG